MAVMLHTHRQTQRADARLIFDELHDEQTMNDQKYGRRATVQVAESKAEELRCLAETASRQGSDYISDTD